MKAVVIERPNIVELRELETPRLGPDDVLVRSLSVGICNTDLEIIGGLLPSSRVTYPCIPGHEWSGMVAEVGSNVRSIAEGDRVVVEGMIPCNHCRSCNAGETNLCSNYDQIGFTRPGGFAELVAVPEHVVHRLPDHVSLDAGALIEPASCVLRAFDRGRPDPQAAIGVIGIGTLGSISIQLARHFEARLVVAYGIRKEELVLAKQLGADHTINAEDEDVERQTTSLVPGGLDLVLETAGAVPAVELATRIVRVGGRVILVGTVGEGRMLQLPSDRFVRKDMEVIGSLSYTSAAWRRTVEILQEGELDLERVITHRFGLPDFRSAIELMRNRQGSVAKILLEHAAHPSRTP